MRYQSAITAKGNSSYSCVSQEQADLAAKVLDDNGCTNCTNCISCTSCTNCTNCINCTYCINCNHCTYCINCTKCKDCDNCNSCTYCDDCKHCVKCTDCQKQPIQLTGLYWIVTIRADNTIKIGCQDHSRKFWENVSEETIARMDLNAPEFWKQYKTLILSIPAPVLNT